MQVLSDKRIQEPVFAEVFGELDELETYKTLPLPPVRFNAALLQVKECRSTHLFRSASPGKQQALAMYQLALHFSLAAWRQLGYA